MRRGQKTSPPAAAVNIWIEQFVLQPHSRPVVTDRVTVRGCEHCSGVIGCQEGLVTNSIIFLAQSRIVVKIVKELLVCCTNIPSRFASFVLFNVFRTLVCNVALLIVSFYWLLLGKSQFTTEQTNVLLLLLQPVYSSLCLTAIYAVLCSALLCYAMDAP